MFSSNYKIQLRLWRTGEIYRHRGSFCQSLTKPIAAGSTIAYFDKRVLMSATKVFWGSILFSRYARNSDSPRIDARPYISTFSKTKKHCRSARSDVSCCLLISDIQATPFQHGYLLFFLEIKRQKFLKISYLCSVFGTVPVCRLTAIGK